ncbi:hypothetical protein ACUXAV_000207 [Cupriavidus metallidurans]|jgi:hypothetical protein|uniref:hypothetical protein n=1 Tax=Cupriavidus TaxID=106589 RepID=UPI000689E387|nr:hypothetical protein [Cupriavidus metallidurans]MDE4918171.1 hypothetical protein [Cupriavidus metallidurans]
MTERQKGGELARLAGMWCGNPEFRRMVADRTGRSCETAGEARAYILERCGIESRAQLDHVPAAEAKFHASVRLPWVRWQQGARQQNHFTR